MGKRIKCPNCGVAFELEEGLEIGETTHCPECYDEMKIVNLNPPQAEAVLGFSEDEYEDDRDQDQDYKRGSKGEDWE
jgi:lysine biosynthesis protein LysW